MVNRKSKELSPSAQRVYQAVRSIPRGSCASYGTVGQAVIPPLSGLVVGRLLAHADPTIPWWRVVGRDGSFPVGKKDPRLEIEQIRLLKKEGVRIAEGCVTDSLIPDVIVSEDDSCQ
jgi:alkylated DNA nucleotide flippase Atl1